MAKYIIEIVNNSDATIASALDTAIHELKKTPGWFQDYPGILKDLRESIGKSKTAINLQEELQKLKPDTVKFVIPDVTEFDKNIKLNDIEGVIVLKYNVKAFNGRWKEENYKSHSIEFLNLNEAIECFYSYINSDDFTDIRIEYDVWEKHSMGGGSGLKHGVLTQFNKKEMQNTSLNALNSAFEGYSLRTIKPYEKRKWNTIQVEERSQINNFFDLYNDLVIKYKTPLSRKEFLSMLNIHY